MNRRSSGDLKAQLRDWVQTNGLNDSLVGTMANYLATMHNLSEGSKEGYLVRLRRLRKRRIREKG